MSISNPKGILIPIGGNEDKGIEKHEIYTLEFIEEGILAHVLKAAGGKDACVVVIPTASSIPVEVGENYIQAFSTLGCKNVHVLDIRSRKDSETPEAIALLKKANCVMFSGGDQSRIIKYIENSTIHDIMVERFIKEPNFVISGTSAGAMAMSFEMIAGGNPKDGFTKGATIMKKGLGLLPEVVIDTHFIKRGRFGRTAEAVAKFPNLLGIGLAEDTGLIIKNANECTVVGSGMVIIFDGSKLAHNNEKILEDGTPMTMTNLTVHVLSNGDQFNIKERTVNVLPLEAPFI